MTFIARDTGNGKDFEPAPAGVWPGRLYRIIDLGTVKGDYQGRPTENRKILLSWELLDPETLTEDGKPHSVHKRVTLSLGKKATLRQLLESWRGKPFTETEASEFDVSKLLGIGGLLNIVHDTKPDGKVYANVQSITPPPRGYTIPPAVNPPITFDCDNPDLAVLESLGKSLREQIESSPEFHAAMKPAAPPPPPYPRTSDPGPAYSTAADFDDDIPF